MPSLGNDQNSISTQPAIYDAEGTPDGTTAGEALTDVANGTWIPAPVDTTLAAHRHSDGLNIGFLDGHADWVRDFNHGW